MKKELAVLFTSWIHYTPAGKHRHKGQMNKTPQINQIEDQKIKDDLTGKPKEPTTKQERSSIDLQRKERI